MAMNTRIQGVSTTAVITAPDGQTKPALEDIKVTSGAAHVSDGALASGPIYTDGTYNYFGEAVPGSALTAAVWRVSRMSISTSQIEWADGNGNFDNVYTSLAVVAALTFS